MDDDDSSVETSKEWNKYCIENRHITWKQYKDAKAKRDEETRKQAELDAIQDGITTQAESSYPPGGQPLPSENVNDADELLFLQA